ncbi:MAG TPA: response regulator transcription factor [Clostridia bacterium]|nr:response regulator transcription factor [Clostridia bacterium]
MRILLIEDERGLADAIAKRLRQEGYAVDLAFDGEEAIGFADAVEYDVLILDLMLPVRDGMNVLRELRRRGNKTLVLILTARDGLKDKVAGLDAGADDYLTKPFSFEELLARIRALLRRKGLPQNTVLKVGDLEVNPATRSVTRAGRRIFLTAKEYAVLEYLMYNSGLVVSRTQIEEHVWDYDFSGASNIVDVYIRYLRRKIDQDFSPKLIETVRGQGYRLRVPE